MPLKLIEDAVGSRNARFLARVRSGVSAAGRGREFAEKLGLKAADQRRQHASLLATNDDHIVLAFRGTESPDAEGLKDWLLTDAVNLLMVPKAG
jgi:hypothetical protein